MKDWTITQKEFVCGNEVIELTRSSDNIAQ